MVWLSKKGDYSIPSARNGGGEAGAQSKKGCCSRHHPQVPGKEWVREQVCAAGKDLGYVGKTWVTSGCPSCSPLTAVLGSHGLPHFPLQCK